LFVIFVLLLIVIVAVYLRWHTGERFSVICVAEVCSVKIVL